MNQAALDSLRREILSSPCLFPMDRSPDGELVHFIRLSEDDYRRASFMDQRMLDDANKARVAFKSGNVPWSLLAPWLQELPVGCDFIFHVSHAGSTLLSRILGEHPDCFAVREPWALRSLVEPEASEQVRDYLALWSRTFRPNQRAVIKATSFVSQIGTSLMQIANGSKAILMYVPAETFLASVLDGSMGDIDSSAEKRLNRLRKNSNFEHITLSKLSPGERAAMSWYVEMESLRFLKQTFPERTLLLDFDQFLTSRENHIRDAAQFLSLNGHESKMLTNPYNNRYAKKIEVSYDASFRLQLLAQSKAKNTEEMERGIRWLQAIGQ
ncbi:MAG: hypothetical protein ACK5PB_12680 [Pirellula sp.]